MRWLADAESLLLDVLITVGEGRAALDEFRPEKRRASQEATAWV